MQAGQIITVLGLGKVTVVRLNKNGTVRVSFWNRLDQLCQVTVAKEDCHV